MEDVSLEVATVQSDQEHVGGKAELNFDVDGIQTITLKTMTDSADEQVIKEAHVNQDEGSQTIGMMKDKTPAIGDGHKIMAGNEAEGNEETSEEPVLDCHVIRHRTGSKRYTCSHCNYGANRHDVIEQHLRTHTGEKPLMCDTCGKSFSQMSVLIRHRKTHTGIKPYQCSGCQLCFFEKNMLTRHIKISCTAVEKDAVKRDAVERDTAAKPFVCEVCGKAFRKYDTLKTHSMIHTNNKPYMCDVCSKTFRQVGHLTNHRRLHTGEKPFSCTVCSAGFFQKIQLLIHMETHDEGPKEHMCDVCGKSFGLPCLLKRHLNNHSKNHVCEICGKKCYSRKDLKNHIMIHSKVKKKKAPQQKSKKGNKVNKEADKQLNDQINFLQNMEYVIHEEGL